MNKRHQQPSVVTAHAILSMRLRRQIVLGSGAFLVLLIALWCFNATIIQDTDWQRMGSATDMLRSVGRYVGVDMVLFPALFEPALETLLIAFLGTFIGTLFCLPVIWFGARNITPAGSISYLTARLTMTISRSVHEIVWALFFVAVVGLGAMAGIFAVAFRSVGFIAKMSSEAIENIDTGPVEAIQATGASNFQVLRYAILPQVLPQIVSVIMFEWEINIRRSAVLGLVGAGGLGLVFFRQMNTFNYHGVTSVMIMILLIILAGELASHTIRRRLL